MFFCLVLSSGRENKADESKILFSPKEGKFEKLDTDKKGGNTFLSIRMFVFLFQCY